MQDSQPTMTQIRSAWAAHATAASRLYARANVHRIKLEPAEAAFISNEASKHQLAVEVLAAHHCREAGPASNDPTIHHPWPMA